MAQKKEVDAKKGGPKSRDSVPISRFFDNIFEPKTRGGHSLLFSRIDLRSSLFFLQWFTIAPSLLLAFSRFALRYFAPKKFVVCSLGSLNHYEN